MFFKSSIHFLKNFLTFTGVVCALGSCTSMPHGNPGVQGNFLRTALVDAFTTVDPYEFSKANAMMALDTYRSAQPQDVIGKKSLTLDECRDIALANNLEIQAVAADEITKRWIEYSSKTKLLPHLTFSGDLSERDNIPMSFSQVWGRPFVMPPPTAAENAVGGEGVNKWSRGHERSTWRYVLETKWSPTDAALAYYVAKSSANDRIKSHFARVRAAQKLLSVVDSAFLRLLALQKCLPVAENVVRSRDRILESTKGMFERKLVTVDDYNRANQQAARAKRALTKTRVEIDKQRNLLATAMGLSPEACQGGALSVTGDLRAPAMNMQICDMEMHAVQKRPEAFEAGLNNLSSDNDLKRLIIKNFPKVTGFWRYTRDKDVFLYNHDWNEVGAFVYFDLLEWISNAEEMNAAVSHKAKTYHEMGSVALAITSQVRVAALQFNDSLDELKTVESALETSQEVYRVAQGRQARDDLDRLSLEEARANMLSGQWEKYKAMGEANAALAELESAIGLNYNEPPPRP